MYNPPKDRYLADYPYYKAGRRPSDFVGSKKVHAYAKASIDFQLDLEVDIVWCKYSAEKIIRPLCRNEVIRRADLDVERRWLIGTIQGRGQKTPSHAFTPKRN